MKKRPFLLTALLLLALLLPSTVAGFDQILRCKYKSSILPEDYEDGIKLTDGKVIPDGYLTGNISISGGSDCQQDEGADPYQQNGMSFYGKIGIKEKISVTFSVTSISDMRRIGGDMLHFILEVYEHNTYSKKKSVEKHVLMKSGLPSATISCSVKELLDEGETSGTIVVKASAGTENSEDVKNGTLSMPTGNEAGISCSAFLTIDGTAAKEDTTKVISVVEDNAAKDKSGIEKYGIPAVVAVSLLGIVAYLRKRQKEREKHKDDEDYEDYDDVSDEQLLEDADGLSMEIYKDFGDTLVAGDVAQLVSVCIMRLPKNGADFVDEELTSQIQITSADDYLVVEDNGIINGWKTAYVYAPECYGDLPEEGVIQCVLANEEASYTNRIHFNIMRAEIKFAQENVTLPACYEREVGLHFIVMGMTPDNATVNARILDNDNKPTNDYRIAVEWDKKKECYIAAINDQLLDKKKDVGVPGKHATYAIEIEAKNKQDFTVKGYLPLYRFYMGLVLDINPNIHCYLEPQDPLKQELRLDGTTIDGKEYVPAENRCKLKIYDYDEDNHKLLIIDPCPENLTWKVRDDEKLLDIQLDEGMTLEDQAAIKRQRLIENQKLLNGLGLQLQPRYSQLDGVYYLLYCRAAALTAPNRFDVELEITASYKPLDPEKPSVLKFSRVVHLLSQPYRTFDDYSAQKAALEKDQKTEDSLRKMEDDIYAAGLSERLAPLLFYIRLQLDLYKPEYGFNERNIRSIRRTYQHIMEGVQAEAQQEVKDWDSLEYCAYQWFNNTHNLIEDMPLLVRLGVGLVTLGSSEVAFMCIEVPYKMKEYVDGGGNSVWGGWFVGVVEVGKAWLMEQGFKAAVGVAKIFGKTAWSGTKGLWAMGKTGSMSRKAVGELGSNLWQGMKDQANTGLLSWWRGQIGWKAGAAEKAAKEAAKKLIDKWRPAAKGSRFNAAEAFGTKRATRNIQDLMSAVELCEQCPTPENVMLRNQIIARCQSDKRTMFLLKNPQKILGDQSNPEMVEKLFDKTRAQFNKTLRGAYATTDQKVIQELAKQTGVHPAKIKIMNATSSNADNLIKGKTVTFDRDITYYWVDETGTTRYFDQKLTERIYADKFREVINSKTLPTGLPSGVKPTPAQLKQAQQLADNMAKNMDQTVVEDILKHHESYGKDLGKMIDKSLHYETLSDPKQVAKAVLNKGVDRFKCAAELMEAAENMTNEAVKQGARATAVGEIMEGCRQQVKVFKLIESRDVMRHFTSRIPEKLRKAVAVMEEMTNSGNASLGEVEGALQELGYTSFEKVAQAMHDLVLKVG